MWYFSCKKIYSRVFIGCNCMIKNFETIDYLKEGNEKQQRAYQTLVNHSVFGILHDFSPLLIGTIPLNVETEKSDLDIICCWKSKNLFIETLIENFAHRDQFLLTEKKIGNRETILSTFQLGEFEIEIFGQNRPTKHQEGYLHMVIEYNVLHANDDTFRQKIIALKREGLSTEEAFAKQLDLTGDPYHELLKFGERYLEI